MELLQFLRRVEVRHTWRKENKIAHGIVKHAQFIHFIDDFVTWMEKTPPIIDSTIYSYVIQFFSLMK